MGLCNKHGQYSTLCRACDLDVIKDHELHTKEPKPPIQYSKGADHHWLEKINSDGHTFGLVCLQWNPGAKRWSHSGYVGSGCDVDTRYWKYVAHCPMPD